MGLTPGRLAMAPVGRDMMLNVKITLLLLATLGTSWTLHAQRSDTLSLGNPSIVGTTVEVPVFINDRSGTPLGMDQPPDLRIGAFAFSILFSNGERVESATAVRSGITADLTPLIEVSLRSSQGTVAYIGSFSSGPVFRLDSDHPGDLVVTLRFLFQDGTSAEVIQATTYGIDGERARTVLSNRAGTTTESLTDGHLTITSSLLLSPARLTLEGGQPGVLTLFAPLSVSPVTVTLVSSHPDVIAVPSSVAIGATGIQIPIMARAVGGPVTITARLFGQSAETIVTVRPSPITIVDSNLDVVIASSRSFRVSLSAPRSTPTTVLLEISDPTAAALPASLTIPAGEVIATGVLRGLSLGRTFEVTATAVGEPGYPASAQGRVSPLTAVDPSPTGSQVSGGRQPVLPILVGMDSTVAVPFVLTTELDIPVVVTLTSSDPSRLVVPGSLTVPPGQRTAFYQVYGVAPGSVTVSASLPAELGGLTVRQMFLVTGNSPAATIPTLSAWSLIALAALLGVVGVFAARTS